MQGVGGLRRAQVRGGGEWLVVVSAVSGKGTCGRCRSLVLSSVGGRRCCRPRARDRVTYAASRLLSSSSSVVVVVGVGRRWSIGDCVVGWSTGRCRREWKVGWDPPPRLWGLGCFSWRCLLVWPVVGCGAQLCGFPLAVAALMAPWQPCTSKCGARSVVTCIICLLTQPDVRFQRRQHTHTHTHTHTGLQSLMQPYSDQVRCVFISLFSSFPRLPLFFSSFFFFFPAFHPSPSVMMMLFFSCLHKLKLILKPRRPVTEARQADFPI